MVSVLKVSSPVNLFMVRLLSGTWGNPITGQAVRQESWQEIESESLLLGKAVTTRRVPES